MALTFGLFVLVGCDDDTSVENPPRSFDGATAPPDRLVEHALVVRANPMVQIEKNAVKSLLSDATTRLRNASNASVWAHEIGHALGVSHRGGDQCVTSGGLAALMSTACDDFDSLRPINQDECDGFRRLAPNSASRAIVSGC